MKRIGWVAAAIVIALMTVVGVSKTGTNGNADRDRGRALDNLVKKAPDNPTIQTISNLIKKGYNRTYTKVGDKIVSQGTLEVIGNRVVEKAGLTDSGQWFWSASPSPPSGNGSFLYHQHYTHGTLCDRWGNCVWENTIELQMVGSRFLSITHIDAAAAYCCTGAWLNENVKLGATAIYQGLQNGHVSAFNAVMDMTWTAPGGLIVQHNQLLAQLEFWGVTGQAVARGSMTS